jgi:hypothetical protein
MYVTPEFIGLSQPEMLNVLYQTGLNCLSDSERRLFEHVLPGAKRLAGSAALAGCDLDDRITEYRHSAEVELPYGGYPMLAMRGIELWPRLYNGQTIDQDTSALCKLPIDAGPLLLEYLAGIAEHGAIPEEADAACTAIRYLNGFVQPVIQAETDPRLIGQLCRNLN